MASVDVPVALLGYGTVGAAVHRLLEDSADEIERATGHRLRVTHALVRDAGKERANTPAPGVLTEDFATILDDPSIQRFRFRYREHFGAAVHDYPLYAAISAGRKHQGYEHWLPFFHERLETLFELSPLPQFEYNAILVDAAE